MATPSAYKELFGDFLNDTIPIGYEEDASSFIIRSEESLETIKWGLEQFAEALSKATSKSVEVEIVLSKEKNSDWIKTYQQSIQPLQIEKFYIRPTWEEPKEDLIDIIIDPALAFGTGHHPTTATCLEAISKYIQPDNEVCDVGCGSGILGIAAMKLGAICDGCDTDPASIENTQTNAKLNGVTFRKLWQGSIQKAPSTYDVVIANIVADVLIFLEKDLKKALKDENSLLILSGIMQDYKEKVLDAYKNYTLLEEIQKDEWITLVLQKKEH